MKRIFLLLLTFLLYIEIVFHITCFRELDFSYILITLLLIIPICVIFTLLCGMSKNKKINTILFRILTCFILILYISQTIYYKIYESFFSYHSFVFLGAVKDGSVKVFETLFQNAIGVLFMLLPLLLIFSKWTKDLEKNNLKDSAMFLIFALAFQIYSIFVINTLNKNDKYSFYNLYYNLDIPVYNTKSFGLLTYMRLSIQRGLQSFEEHTTSSEDIYTNEKTALLSKVDTEYNSLSIDFSSLSAKEENKKIKEIHQYIGSKSATKENEYTGIFKDKNVIYILAESLSNIAIDKEITPTLYKMYQESYYFDHYYSPKFPAGTADGEYMLEWGLLPVIGNDYSLIDLVYIDHPYNVITMFKENNYTTHAYHNYYGYYNLRDSYFKTLNFDSYKFVEDLKIDCSKNYHSSDLDLVNASFDDYKNDKKFFTYYITLSGHGDYSKNNNMVVKKNWNLVKDLKVSANLKGYYAAHIEFDRALESLLQKLKQAKKLDNTIIVISSDHYPYFLTDNDLKTGYKHSINKFSRNKGTFFIWSNDKKKSKGFSKYGMNTDVVPTLYNLMGFSFDSRLFMGTDLMSDSDGLVILPDRSFITEKGTYDASKDKFNKNKKAIIPDNYVNKISDDVADRFKYSKAIQYNNYYKYVPLGGKK